jgi:Ca2+-binding EF-hand superfamily protein
MKALAQASIMEQIMVRFVSSATTNQEQLRKCREQY